ncbi:hypothetical protein, partial [Neisseria meningitidis]|uniref:hypothetical protein n=3 Tax=Neisseria meningitidis TaxID=487 RepID=UPI001F5C8587
FNSGKRSMCLAIMAWAVCWKKVLMRNLLNVLVGFWGILQRSQPYKLYYWALKARIQQLCCRLLSACTLAMTTKMALIKLHLSILMLLFENKHTYGDQKS